MRAVGISSLPFAGGRRSGAFTLVELLVALALSALLMRLILPMFAAARSDSFGGSAAPEGELLKPWRTILHTDVARLVSPVKAGLATVRVERIGELGPPQLVLQTLSPPGIGTRGPVEVTYKLESDSTSADGTGLSLVRYGHGWHDGSRTRHLLASGLSGWELHASDDTWQQSPGHAPLVNGDRGSLLSVILHRTNQPDVSADFWVATRVNIVGQAGIQAETVLPQ